MIDRINREELFIEIAEAFAKRSTCPRGHVGAIVVRDKRIVSSGYNGAPAGMAHCTEVGCTAIVGQIREPEKDGACQRAVHAESNAIAYAAREGIELFGTELFTTYSPCVQCAQLIINAGIKRVVYKNPYRDRRGLMLLDEANVQIHAFGQG